MKELTEFTLSLVLAGIGVIAALALSYLLACLGCWAYMLVCPAPEEADECE